jgi:secretion/DNA translocation related TadE-like protein
MRRLGDERGSVSVVIAGALVVVLVCTLGVADLARALRARAQTRTAADAAALAAAQELAVPGEEDPTVAAHAIAERNGATLVACECAAGTYDAVVTVTRDLDGLWILRGTLVLTAKARAVVDLP